MKQLPGLILKQKYYNYVRAEIQRIFDEVIYIPLAKVIKQSEIRNSLNDDPLYAAIKNGTVWFENGRFYGNFNARISKRLQELGASYNSKSATWSYAGTLPAEVSLATAAAASRYTALRESVLSVLNTVDNESINRISNIPDVYQQTIHWMNDDFEKAVKSVTIPPKLTQQQVNILSSEWGMNLDLYIRKWADENILNLREQVQSNAFSGQRAEAMIEMIQTNYQVSKRKAQFLARQETSLLMSKFHETRFIEAGMLKYKWSTSDDERVRHDHELLDGRIFEWGSPPVVNRAKGTTGHPGEDFGCRCIAIPIAPNRGNTKL